MDEVLNGLSKGIKEADVVSIQIPREVLHATRMTPEELRLELAITLFQRGKLSFGKAREMAGMNAWDFQQLLGSRGISVHYGVEEYEEDLRTLKVTASDAVAVGESIRVETEEEEEGSEAREGTKPG